MTLKQLMVLDILLLGFCFVDAHSGYQNFDSSNVRPSTMASKALEQGPKSGSVHVFCCSRIKILTSGQPGHQTSPGSDCEMVLTMKGQCPALMFKNTLNAWYILKTSPQARLGDTFYRKDLGDTHISYGLSK